MTMPAGKYYVGDLCYVMHKEWDEFCDLTISGNKCLEGEFTLKDGRRFATFSTAYGDGLYKDQFGNRYSVDAGLIGCIKIDDLDLENEDNFTSGGQVVEFKQDFSVNGGRSQLGSDWSGIIQIGHVLIDTDGDGFDDEDYDCDDES